MGKHSIFYMFENPRRGRQARNFTTNDPKILDLKSSSEQIFSENWRWVPLNIVPSVRQSVFMLSESVLGNILPHIKRLLDRHSTKISAVLYTDENLLWSTFHWDRGCHGNEMLPLQFLLAFVFLSTRKFFHRNCLRELVLPLVVSILNKFYESLLEIFWNEVLRVIKTVPE